MSIRIRDQQLQFEIPRQGGKRKGAGRKKRLVGSANHEKRPRITKHTPMHITLKLAKGLGGLRSFSGATNYARAAEQARVLGLRIVHFSLQSNHLHMICEADDNEHLQSGMRSLIRSLTVMIKCWTEKVGDIFAGRYHMHRLDTPTEVRNAVRYVLYNHDHHCKKTDTIDAYSSIIVEVRTSLSRDWISLIKSAVSEPRSWLLRNHGRMKSNVRCREESCSPASHATHA